MNPKFNLALLLVFLSSLPAKTGDQPSVMPPDVRWKGNEAKFFFVNSGDTTEFWHSFSRATTLWQPGNFSMSITGDASNNRPCVVRPAGVRVVNIAQFSSTACNGGFGQGVLAVTFNQWDSVTHEMLAADISFNTAYTWNIYTGHLNSARHDFQRVAVHELGHAAGLNHSTDQTSIMFPVEGDVEQPSQNDQQTLRLKYAAPVSPAPPGEFACGSQNPHGSVVELGTLTQTTRRLGECLDGSFPSTTFWFELNAPRTINMSLVSDETEINVELISGNTGYWQSVNNGVNNKSKMIQFPIGRYFLRTWFQTSGSHYRLQWEFQ